MTSIYHGRIAPSPTGYLHVGHAITFWHAQQRAVVDQGALVLRIEDLDPHRCRKEFCDAAMEDLAWFGLRWTEGPDVGGPAAPYLQSQRRSLYLNAWRKLREAGLIYPCRCSRSDVLQAAIAPHEVDDEPLYPGTCRPRFRAVSATTESSGILTPHGTHWRFRVPDGEKLSFCDGAQGEQTAIAGKDFGDFVVWRKDDVPAYQLAVVVDDAAMGISEVVRGEDLLMSTFRQLLIYAALGKEAPHFYHTPLVRDESGKRLAKCDAVRSLRAIRAAGMTPEEVRHRFL